MDICVCIYIYIYIYRQIQSINGRPSISTAGLSDSQVQGYLAHKKHPPP